MSQVIAVHLIMGAGSMPFATSQHQAAIENCRGRPRREHAKRIGNGSWVFEGQSGDDGENHPAISAMFDSTASSTRVSVMAAATVLPTRTAPAITRPPLLAPLER